MINPLSWVLKSRPAACLGILCCNFSSPLSLDVNFHQWSYASFWKLVYGSLAIEMTYAGAADYYSSTHRIKPEISG